MSEYPQSFPQADYKSFPKIKKLTLRKYKIWCFMTLPELTHETVVAVDLLTYPILCKYSNN